METNYNKKRSEFEISIDKLIKSFSQMMPDLGNTIITVFQAYIGAAMGVTSGNFSGKTVSSFSKTPGKLNVRSGRLYRSFGLNPESEDDTLSKATYSGAKLAVSLGSNVPYASIQNEGGKIWSRGKMYHFFMYKYATTKDKMWLYTALKLYKKGYIEIKPTNYFTDASKDFLKKGLPIVFDSFYRETLKPELKKIGLI